MKLTLIEPHQHMGVLRKWLQVVVHTEWKIEVISSGGHWGFLSHMMPEVTEKCSFIDLQDLKDIPPSDLIIFLSVQLQWKWWLKKVEGRNYGILVHNGSMYFEPYTSMASRKESGFSYPKYLAKKPYEKYIRTPQRNLLLEGAKFVTPFSYLQLPYFEEYSPVPVEYVSPSFKPTLCFPKKNQVLLYMHNRLDVTDGNFLSKQYAQYKSDAVEKIFLIADLLEANQLFRSKPPGLQMTIMGYPVLPWNYYALLEQVKAVCLPFCKDWTFNIFHEEIGRTKYSGRIRDALEYGCEVHVPEEIPLEDASLIPTLEEAVLRMEKQLTALMSGS